jgi:hypothetical protein
MCNQSGFRLGAGKETEGGTKSCFDEPAAIYPMTIELIGVIALTLGIVSIFCPPAFIVNLFLYSILLGASAASILEALGGASLQPAHLLLGFLVFRLLRDNVIVRNIIHGFAFGRPGFWLLLTTIYCTATAYILPRLFAGQTLVVPARAESAYVIALAPSMTNLTQSIYFIGDFVCFVVLSGYATSLEGRKVLGNAALRFAALNLIFAVLDLVTYFTNTTELLSFIRNGTYGLLSDTEVAGFKRIVGSFTEASSFGSMTLGCFAFTGKLWLRGIRPRLTSILTFLSFAALIFSTSTTAYVGLFAFLAFSYLENLPRILHRSITSQMAIFIFVIPVIAAIVVIAIGFSDTYSIYLRDLLDTFVLKKMTTDSGMERSSWNRQAMENFFDTFGFGTGNGSLRTSSFPIAVLANLGIVGAVLFGLFFLTVFFSFRKRRPIDGLDDAYRQAAKSACFAWLITATVSGALVDLGLAFFALAALACSRPADVQRQEEMKLSDVAF